MSKWQEIAQNHWPFTLQAIKAKEKWKSQKEFSRWKEIEEIRQPNIPHNSEEGAVVKKAIVGTVGETCKGIEAPRTA